MWLAEPLQQRCKPEVSVLLLQLTDPLPRQTLSMAQALPALQFSQGVSRVFSRTRPTSPAAPRTN
jgi:hypothetical protein